jgi:universal stress protein family protein
VVSSQGLTLAGPGAVAACEQAVLREAAQLEASLARTGARTGVQYKFIVRQGELWPELREIIPEESTDLLVVGTHGRHGVSKLFFGSVAEQIFRQAGCPLLIFGPHPQQLPRVGSLESPNVSVLRRTWDRPHSTPDPSPLRLPNNAKPSSFF